MEERRKAKEENDSKYPKPRRFYERIQLEDGRFALKITDRYISALGRKKGYGGKSIEEVYDIDLDVVTILEIESSLPKEAWGYAAVEIDFIVKALHDEFKRVNNIPLNVTLR